MRNGASLLTLSRAVISSLITTRLQLSPRIRAWDKVAVINASNGTEYTRNRGIHTCSCPLHGVAKIKGKTIVPALRKETVVVDVWKNMTVSDLAKTVKRPIG